MFHSIFNFFLQHNSRLLTAWFSEELGKSSLASEPGTVESSPSAALPGRNSTSRCHQSSASSDSPSSSRRETKASTAFCDRPPDRKRSARGASWRRTATAFSTSFGWPNWISSILPSFSSVRFGGADDGLQPCAPEKKLLIPQWSQPLQLASDEKTDPSNAQPWNASRCDLSLLANTQIPQAVQCIRMVWPKDLPMLFCASPQLLASGLSQTIGNIFHAAFQCSFAHLLSFCGQGRSKKAKLQIPEATKFVAESS